jgi:hypothetical protein
MAGLLSFLSDINVKAGGQPTGPLASLGSSDYNMGTYRYPSDLSASDKGHYMLININEQRLTSYPGIGTNGTPTAILNNLNLGSSAAGAVNVLQTVGSGIKEAGSFGSYLGNQILNISGIRSGIDSLKSTTVGGAVVGAASSSFNILGEIGDRLQNGSIRAEKRITTTIALYMPDTLVFDHHQGYNKIESGGSLFAAAASLAPSTVDLYKNGNMTPEQKGAQFARNVSPFIASMLSKSAGGLAQVAFSQAFGVVQNPMLEVLYSSPDFRTFRFDFQFYPRSEAESKEVQNIIKELRFHQAPEVAQGGTGGFFMIPPSEFDITFYYSGQENPNIPKISTCVLENLTIDYAPNGFSAYEVPGQGATLGGTGMPVAIRLSLQFRETEIVTKASIKGTPTMARSGTGFGDDSGEEYTTDSLGNTFKNGTLYRAAEVEGD